MISRLFRVVVVGLLTSLFSLHVQATVIQASSCSREDVRAAIDSAADGDVVVVPAGICVWVGGTANNERTSSGVYIESKSITLFGAGIDSTVIQWEVNHNYSAAIWINSDKYFRISGFTFRGQPGDKGMIHYEGVTQEFRIDHNKFDDINGKALDMFGGFGVIDNNSFVGRFRGMNLVGVDTQSSWNSSWIPGSKNAVFIENNRFNQSNRYTSVSCHWGCRYTFRYNDVTNGAISTHGADTGSRAGGVIEAYGNHFQSDPETDRGVVMRGGTGIFFNNIWDNYRAAISFANYRTCYGITFNQPHASNDSRCDGAAAIDGNHAREGHTGSHNGVENALSLTDTGKSFESDKFVGWHVWNLSDGSKCKITANDASSVSCVLEGGAENLWDVGDEYRITSGWPCKDQVGRAPSAEDELGVFQKSEPVYFWNNQRSLFGGPRQEVTEGHWSGFGCEDPSPQEQILQGDDFVNGPRPGYAPYVYPHPLRMEGGNPPAPPANLRVPTDG
jgi:hypothetical protein